MKYKITKYNLKTKEKLIAAFSDLTDAELYIVEKRNQDELNNTKAVYRIYDDNKLVHEYGNDTVLVTDPEDPETYSNASFLFNVKIQSVNSLERTTIAYLNNEKDAYLFVTGKCAKEHSLDNFLIFKEHVLIATLNSTLLENKALNNSGLSVHDKRATLSPLSTRPTPPGGPDDYWIEHNEEDL